MRCQQRLLRDETSSRGELYVEPASGSFRVAQQRLGARQCVTIFKPGDGGLAGAHPGREFGLREACTKARPKQLGSNLELRSQRVILGFDLGVGEQSGFELFELDSHMTSFARRSASSISARGVFCVFFTNARTTTTLRPIAVM